MTRQVSSRNGTIVITGDSSLLIGGMGSSPLKALVVLMLPTGIMLTSRVLWVPVLRVPESIPLQMSLGTVTVIMGIPVLSRVTGLRPTLLVGQFLVRTQSTLPSPRVFLRVTGKPIFWFRQTKLRALPKLRVSLLTQCLRSLSIRLTQVGSRRSRLTTLLTCRGERAPWWQVKLNVRKQKVTIRVAKAPAVVILTLTFVRALTTRGIRCERESLG